MQRQAPKKNYIEDFASVAMRFIKAKNRHEWEAVKSELAEYACTNDDYHIRQLLDILATFLAKKMGQSIDQEAYKTQLSELAKLPHDNIIYFYARITAEILEFAEQPHGYNIIQIVWSLSQLKAAVNHRRFKVISEMNPALFEEWCQGLPNIINGLSINDCVAESEIGEYAHYLLELLIDLLLTRRDDFYKNELGFFNDIQKDEFSLTKQQLSELQWRRNDISKIDTVLWRLNLHAHPTIRTQLERHIKIHHVNACEYIKHDYVNSNLKINCLSQVILDINDALPLIFNHLEHMQTLVNSYELIKYDKTKATELYNYRYRIVEELDLIILDCTLYSGQLDTMPSDKKLANTKRLIELASVTASALIFLLGGDYTENFDSGNFEEILHLDDLTNFKLANAASAYIQARLRIYFERKVIDKEAKERLFIYNIEYLESALKYNGTNIIYSNSFIKNYYYFLLTFCKSSAELDLIQRNGLMVRIQALKIPKLSQHIYDLMYYANDKVTRMISDQGYETGVEFTSIDERILIQLLNKCNDDVFQYNFENNAVATYTANLFIDYAYLLSEHFEDHPKEDCRLRSKIIESNIERMETERDILLSNYFSKTSPAFLRFRNVIIMRNKHDEPSIKYPDERTLLSKICNILKQIRIAKSEQDFEEIRKTLEQANTLLEKLGVEFDDVIDQSNSIELSSLYDLFQTERTMVNFLTVMLARRDQRFTTEMKLSDFTSLDINATASCNMAIIYNYYVMVIAAIQQFNELDCNNPDNGNIGSYLNQARSILLDLFKFKVLTKSKIRYQFFEFLSHEVYWELISGLHIMLAPDKMPENQAEKCMMEYTDILIEKILSIRHNVEKCANQCHAEKKHDEFLRLSYTLEEHDTLLKKLNLANHKELRGRYKRHIQLHELTNEMKGFNLSTAVNRVFIFSGLLNVDDKKKGNRYQGQFSLAADIILSHVIWISTMFSMIGIVTDDKYDQYEALLPHLEWQIARINHDVKFMIAWFLSLMIDDSELALILNKLMLGYAISRQHVQDSPDQFQYYYDNYSNLYDITIDNIINQAVSESVSQTIFGYFEQQIKQSSDVKRLAAFQSMANYIRKNAEIVSHHNKVTTQYITDIFLYAYLSCETQEDVNALLANDLKNLVFNLELTKYGRNARDLLFSDIEEKKRVKQTNTPHDPDVIKKNTILLQVYFKNMDIAFEEHANAPHDQKNEKTIIAMKFKILKYFLKIADDLMKVINKQELNKKYDKIITTITDQIKLFQRKFISSESTYRPITINVSSHVSESFKLNEKEKQQQPVRKRITGKKTATTNTTHFFDERLQTDYEKVAARYHHNVKEIRQHYSKLLNSKDRSVKDNQNIQIKSVIGLMSLLPMVQEDDYRQQVIEEMELHFAQLTKQVHQDTYNELFFGKYHDYLAAIQKYKRVHQSMAVARTKKQEPLSVIAIATTPKYRYQPCLYAPVKSYTIDQPRPIPARIPKWLCLPKRELPAELAEFSMMWRDISLDIELNPNELTLMSFLHKQRLIPLIQAGAVGDTIRGVPYRDVDTVCFAKQNDLEILLRDNQELLDFKSCVLMHDTFFRLSYTVDCDDEEVIDVAFIQDTMNKAVALNKMATNYVMGVTMYYDYFNKVLLDPRHLFTLTKNHIIDLHNRFDPDFNVDQFFIDHPDRFIKVLATVSKSLKYDVVVQADYVKEVIIRNKQLLYRPDLKSKYPQSLLDKLICHGYTDQVFIIFHKQCDIFLNLLFPLFSKTPHDIEIIRRTCNKAALRYQAYEREYINTKQYNPKKRMLMLSKEHENHMRIGFWRDLLQDKFLKYYEAAAMINNVDLLDRGNFASELRNYLFKLSFVINRSVIKALEDDFWSILERNIGCGINQDYTSITNRSI